MASPCTTSAPLAELERITKVSFTRNLLILLVAMGGLEPPTSAL